MSQRTSNRNRRLAVALGCLAVVFGIALFILWYFPGLTFHAVRFADGPRNYFTEWKTILFISVTENIETFPSEEEARREFDDRIAHAETIIERTTNPTRVPNADERVLGTFINSLNERKYSIVRLKKENVYQTYAPSLRYALALEKFQNDH